MFHFKQRIASVMGMLVIVMIIAETVSGDNLATSAVKTRSRDREWKEIRLTEFDGGSKESFRGLSVVDSKCVWASGSGGTVIRTLDAGANWKQMIIRGAEKTEFRDIHAFDEKKAIVLGAGSPGLIYSTADGGESWKKIYENSDPRIFFDAFDFWDDQHGIAFSDPIFNRLAILQTRNGGTRWKLKTPAASPVTKTGEAGFAASGTCLTTQGRDHVWIGLGGKPVDDSDRFARVLFSVDRGESWQAAKTPLRKSESAGLFSLAFVDANRGFAVGGDYRDFKSREDTICKTTDGGKNWTTNGLAMPGGFRSCIATRVLDGQLFLIVTGTNGTEVSLSAGRKWEIGNETGFHVVQFDRTASQPTGWMTGGNGKIARFEIR